MSSQGGVTRRPPSLRCAALAVLILLLGSAFCANGQNPTYEQRRKAYLARAATRRDAIRQRLAATALRDSVQAQKQQAADPAGQGKASPSPAVPGSPAAPPNQPGGPAKNDSGSGTKFTYQVRGPGATRHPSRRGRAKPCSTPDRSRGFVALLARANVLRPSPCAPRLA
jgi:hypothetical protein